VNRRPPHSEHGQVLVIVAMGLVVIVSMVGLVIDGGRAWTYQRDTQNGADAVAKAGAGVLQHYLAGSGAPTDGDVGCAADEAAAANAVVPLVVEYTDFKGDVIGVTVGACGTTGTIPTGAQGVRARTSETFDTLLMSVIGVPTLTAEADAIAVVGTLLGFPGGALPVTFPQTANICDRVNPVQFQVREDNGNGTWEPYEIVDPETTALTTANEAIVPLCDTAPGSVGWLDWGCGQNLSQSITNPCDIFIPIPAWVQTKTGNVNSLETEINAYAGSVVGTAEASDSVVALPIHDFTCGQDRPDSSPPSSCPSYPTWSGNGNNLYYHIPFWVGFKLDHAYVQGGDVQCRQAPGSPLLANPDPPGKVGCLKGWFVAQYTAPGEIGIGVIPPDANQPLGVTLVN
jgi:hypothetical protein